jgi:hypothetical protein
VVSSKIFRSRWSALWWSAGILWTAYDVASAAPSKPATANASASAQQEDATGAVIDNADLAVLANAISSN